MPPRKPPIKLARACLNALGAFLKDFSSAVAKTSYSISTTLGAEEFGLEAAERRGTDYREDQLKWLQNHLFSSVPWYQYGDLVDVILNVLSSAAQSSKAVYRKMNSSPESIHEIHVIIHFARLILHPRITRLDLSKLPKLLRDCLYKYLHELKGLEILNLGSGNGETGRKRMFMSLKYLKNLRSLTLINDCQNETLAVIGQNCPHLAHLDINSSHSITDQGITWILRCKELVDLDLYQTSISVQAYAQLLLGLPRLQTVGRCDSFGQVLEYIGMYNGDPVRLSVRSLHSRDMSYEQLRLLVEMCPKLTHVNLYVDEDSGDLLEPLTELESLRELKLLACNFYADKVDELLKKKGSSLVFLHLEHIDELDMNALICIAENCSNLERLFFISCDFVENFGVSHVDKVFDSPPFRKLEELVCVSESAPNIIEFLLTHADRIRKVQFGSTAWFNDETVRKVLDKNALRHVREIRILRSYELTMTSVNLLLELCPELHILAEMDGWEGISELELLRLRDRIKTQNYDLDTFITWSVTG